jgi:hypothetical protein
MLIRPALLLATVVGLTGCANIPDVGGADAAAARNAPYPTLIPLDDVLSAAQRTPAQITPATIATTNDRIARLRARAASLRGPVVDAGTRSRMRAASARAALR